MRRRLGWGVGLWVAGVVACDVRPAAPAVANCPPCECKCDGEEAKAAAASVVADTPAGEAGAAGADAAAVATSPGGGGGAPRIGKDEPALPDPSALPNPALQQQADIGELIASATRKMHFDDGAGCLADLDKVVAIDPKYEARIGVTRGMCEMRAGRCQDGKKRIARYYEQETNTHPERAAAMAESIAAMNCRGGDSTERDRLLRAYFDLSDGAYMNKKTVAQCNEALETARKLIPKVKPNGPEDYQIKSGPQALFHTAATCIARAGDCTRAFAVYRELYPDLSQIPDPAVREKVIRESFETSIAHCAPQPKAPAVPEPSKPGGTP